MDNDKQVMTVDGDGSDDAPMLSLGDSLIEVARNAEARIEAVKKIKQIALKVTNSHDWIDEHGKPYLQVSGAEKIARVFGVNWHLTDPQLETDSQGNFSFTYSGTFTFRGASITAIGTRSSKDDFFSRSFEWKKDEQGRSVKIATEVPPEKVDRMDVKKGAYTNCIGNGITRLLGIRNLEWSELNSAGIYASGGKIEAKKKEGEPEKQRFNVNAPASDKQRNFIFSRMTHDLGLKTEKDRHDYGVKVTGKESATVWTSGDIDTILKDISKQMGEKQEDNK